MIAPEGVVPIELFITQSGPAMPTELIAIARGFESEATATEAGEKARSALRAVGVATGVALDLGRDESTGGPSDYLKDKAAEEGLILRGRFDGLDVYEEGEVPVKVLSISFTGGYVSSPLNQFTDLLIHELTSRGVLAGDLSLAIDLYFLTDHEASDRARFLNLVTAVEVLSTREDRPETLIDLIDSFIAQTNLHISTAPESDAESARSLVGSLQDLKKESIGSAIRGVVKRHIPDGEYFDGKPAGRFASDCYDARSDLSHIGRSATEISAVYGELRRLVKTLLERLLTEGE
ncbi:MAG: hypothetical protein WD206_07210 [Actinomycetota bacterium]